MVSVAIMKTIIKTAMCALSLVLMSSCTYKSDDNMAREEYISVVNNILQKNDKELKKLICAQCFFENK